MDPALEITTLHICSVKSLQGRTSKCYHKHACINEMCLNRRPHQGLLSHRLNVNMLYKEMERETLLRED